MMTITLERLAGLGAIYKKLLALGEPPIGLGTDEQNNVTIMLGDEFSTVVGTNDDFDDIFCALLGKSIETVPDLIALVEEMYKIIKGFGPYHCENFETKMVRSLDGAYHEIPKTCGECDCCKVEAFVKQLEGK